MAENAPAPISGDVEKKVMLVALDDREHSLYALQWTLDHFAIALGDHYKLVIVHAKPIPSSVIGLGGPGAAVIFPHVDSELRKAAAQVIEKAREMCVTNSVINAEYLVVEGDARNVLCDAVERLHADLLVVGSHSYGVVKRALLGSVSDYCAHHAHCTVMIVKKPKHKH